MKIGFLGLGNMGTPMALRLIAAGHELAVWNRSEECTKPLIHEGAIAAATPAEAELGADAVITMLWDDAAYEHVVFGANGLMDALSPGGLHISCSTISVAMSERLTLEYAQRGVEFIAAPVFGSPGAAGEGQLSVIAAGSDSAMNRARPLLEAFSRIITVVGQKPRLANAAVLGGHYLLGTMLKALAESWVFAASEGIKPDTFSEAINNALFQSPFYAACAGIMLDPTERHGDTLERAAKDLRLLRQAAAHRRTHLSFAENLAETIAEARNASPGRNWAAAFYQIAQRREKAG